MKHLGPSRQRPGRRRPTHGWRRGRGNAIPTRRPARGAPKPQRQHAAERSRSDEHNRLNGRELDGRSLDGGVLASTALLAALGIVMVYSATAPLAIGSVIPPLFARHLLAVMGGVLCVAVGLRVPVALWQRLALPIWAAGVVLLLATLAFGVEVNGARRWLPVPGLPVRFQPAELAKWATVVAVAALLAGRGGRAAQHPRSVANALGLAVVPVVLMLAQPDFGSAAVVIALAGLLVFVAGAPLRWLAPPALAAMVGAGLYVALRPYALARWTGFLDPWRTSRSEGFQLVQSFVAFGRGGPFGVGIGDGRQKLFYLPEAHTDFILSVVAEETGLFGVCLVLGSFAALVAAGGRVAARARDPFAMLLAFGMTTLVTVPAAVNAAVVMGLLPTTGFTLPFLSFGGTSLLVCAFAVGVLLRIASREAPTPRARVGSATPRGLVRS